MPVLVIASSERRSPEEDSLGTKPRKAASDRGHPLPPERVCSSHPARPRPLFERIWTRVREGARKVLTYSPYDISSPKIRRLGWALLVA